MYALSQKIKSFVADTNAAASIEFVIIAPILFFMVFSIFEAGWLMTKQTMLARGLNMAIRDLRLGKVTGADSAEIHENIKAKICEKAMIFRDCSALLHLEVREIDLATGIPWSSPTCVDRGTEDVAPLVVSTGNHDDDPSTMFVRACVVVDPLIPGSGLGAHLTKDPTGGYHMVAFSAFRNEPG